ncbi:OmpA family protein [Rhodoferax sp. 4810]|uniref:OmpA family protein n=1 Tax=Thiospirillum jenense TaxID=1653858 RepID=A0A839HK34_9GAMM|nr:OmpA family protein [Thiospirillum jenense]MBB1076326.1 OmpA family protein [Rhodoferax jenense]MBB1126262.1 OmpA family protein [Thiospirillum jenense]
MTTAWSETHWKNTVIALSTALVAVIIGLLVVLFMDEHQSDCMPTTLSKTVTNQQISSNELAMAHQRIQELEKKLTSTIELEASETTWSTMLRNYGKLRAQLTPESVTINLGETELKFAQGKATLPTTVSTGVLAILATILQQQPELRVLLQGHTDNVGDNESNQILSLERAEAVKKALIKLGISPDHLHTEGMGETQPLVPNDSAMGRTQNRRVEVHLIFPN